MRLGLWKMAQVAPFAGAWIEILKRSNLCGLFSVAPFAGAWIEITADWEAIGANMSLPSRERGLKLHGCHTSVPRQLVAPFAGAWIEITA